MKILSVLFVLLSSVSLFAKVHYAKVEPYESVVLKSAVSALVVDVDLDAEGTTVASKKVIHLDDALDVKNLESTKQSIVLLEQMQKLNSEIEQSLSSTMGRQKSYYERINKMSTSSKTQKDNAFSSYISAKSQYLNTKEKIVNLDKQILDLQYKKAQLEDAIAKKSIILENKYLYKLIVRKGDFVNFGSPLARVDDMSRAKLVLFLDAEELENLEQKIVYVDDVKTNYKVDKVWKVADEKFISSYRAEIYMDAPQDTFSKLMKVEIKQ